MITLPKPPIVKEKTKNKGVFVIENCYPGYGVTIANALRRVILSSLPGGAIVAIKIKGAMHEFSTLPYVNENIIDIILNIKNLRFTVHEPGVYELSLKESGAKEVKAGNIKVPAEVEIVDNDLPLATLTDDRASLDMILYLGYGVGYEMSNEHKGNNDITGVGVIKIDSIFSPVLAVNYVVENMRVGDKTDYNRIILTIETNGVVPPEKCLYKGLDILIDNFNSIKKETDSLSNKKQGVKTKENKKASSDKKVVSDKKEKAFNNKIDENKGVFVIEKTKNKDNKEQVRESISELKLSLRVENILKDNKLGTIDKLSKSDEEKLSKIDGIGDKAIKDIRRKLGKFGIILK